ncbi:hypothetical protein Avbf_15547 [Armadillidium vulgare]|nr:hypothetical protein Avbf_15547 [Armadillidium vulgare]
MKHKHEFEPDKVHTLQKRNTHSHTECEATSFQQIYDEELLRFPLSSPSFACIRKNLSKIRQTAYPMIPKNFQELELGNCHSESLKQSYESSKKVVFAETPKIEDTAARPKIDVETSNFQEGSFFTKMTLYAKFHKNR